MKRFFRALCLGCAAICVAATSFAQGQDVTAMYLRNADMEQGVKYWAMEGEKLLVRATKDVGVVVGFHGMYKGVLEAWNNSWVYDPNTESRNREPIGNSRTMQRIKNMPNGTYVFGAYVGASQQNARNWITDEFWSNRDSIYGVSLFANDNEVPIATDNPDWGAHRKWIHSSKFNVVTTVTDGMLNVGLKVDSTNANYVVWDNATLYYFGDMSEADALDAMAEIDMDNAAAVADTLTDGIKMNVDTLANLKTAIAAIKEGKTTAATLWDDSEDLFWNIGLAHKSITDYRNLAEDIEAALLVAGGEWTEDGMEFYYPYLSDAIDVAQEAYDEAIANRTELAELGVLLDRMVGWMRVDSLYTALDELRAFIESPDAFTNAPGKYSEGQKNMLKALCIEVEDSLSIVENAGVEDARPQDLYPYIAQVYAAIENVKNNPISAGYTQMPIEFNRSSMSIDESFYYIEGAELNAEGLVSYASPLYRFKDKIEMLRITVNSAANNTAFFCLSELVFFDVNGNKIELTADNITSNADHNTLNPNSPDGGGLVALLDGQTGTFFHSAWMYMPAEAHYLEITLPNGGYDAFSFQMIARENNGYESQNKTFPGEMVISAPMPERDALEAEVAAAKALNPYSFPEVGYYVKDFSYLSEAIIRAEAILEGNPTEEECLAMMIELQEARGTFEADEDKVVRLPEPGKAYRIVSAFPGFYEKQSVEKAIKVNVETNTLWWEDAATDSLLQEFMFEPILYDGEPYVMIEEGENEDGTIWFEVYYCYYMKNVATGLYVDYDDDNSFMLTEQPTDTVLLKHLGRGQWNIIINDYNEETGDYDEATLHTGDHNSGNPSTGVGGYGGTWGMSSGICSYRGGIDTPSAWYIREYPSLPYEVLVEGAEFKSGFLHFGAADILTLTADKDCSFADLALYDIYGNTIAIDSMVIEGNTVTIRQENKLVACAFAFTNNEGVSTVTLDAYDYSKSAISLLQVAYDNAVAVAPIEGAEIGQYADIIAYTTAIEKAAAMLAASATDEEIYAMIDELQVVIENLVPNMPIPGHMYYIVSAWDVFVENHGASMMIYDNEEGAPYWTYENLYELNRCWEFEQATEEELSSLGYDIEEQAFYLKNVATGMYMGYDDMPTAYKIFMVDSKEETIPYTIIPLGGDAVAIAAIIDSDSRLHARDHREGVGNLGNICYWFSGAGTASAWRICEAETYGLDYLVTYTMQAQDVESKASSVVYIPISMENSGAVTAFQFDLYLPDGVSVASTLEDGEVIYDITLNGERAKSSHMADAEIQPDGALRVLVFSAENVPFEGNSGVVLEVGVTIGDLEDGNYSVVMRDIRMSAEDGTEELCPDFTANLTIQNTLMGDVNSDGSHTISDVVMVINAILGRTQTNFDVVAADMNGDGLITVGDAISVLRLVLGDGTAKASARSISRGVMTVPELDACEFSVIGDSRVVLPVALNNTEAYGAFQLDVVLPEGVELVDAALTGRARASHATAWNTLADGRVRIVAYAVDNATFRGNEGALLNLVLNTSNKQPGEDAIILSNGLFATVEGAEHQTNDLSVVMRSETTGIDAAVATFRAYGVENAVEIVCNTGTTVSIYATTGQLVEQVAVKAGKSVITLPEGVYVINGNKVVVK